jgi:hypothetical protein
MVCRYRHRAQRREEAICPHLTSLDQSGSVYVMC